MDRPYFLIGIGGIGMSALARILKERGHPVMGSEKEMREALSLSRIGIEVLHQPVPELISEGMNIVYSSSIKNDHPELSKARNLNLNIQHRSEVLRDLMAPSKGLLVSGCHGKTTTSALLASTLIHLNEDPSFAIGGVLKEEYINGRHGRGPYFVAEADESDGSMVTYDPFGLIVTNIEEDHLDHYKTLFNIQTEMSRLASKVKNREFLFWCSDCPNLSSLNWEGIKYGFQKGADLLIENCIEGKNLSYDIQFKGNRYSSIEVPLQGRHNALNSAAVFGFLIQLGFKEASIREALLQFKGVKRRMEVVGEKMGIKVIDDYAHHPTEIKALLKTLRISEKKRRIIAVFQPHRYSRTRDLLDTFASSFEEADKAYITDLYSAGEAPIEGIDAQALLVRGLEMGFEHLYYLPADRFEELLLQELRPHDVVVFIGAGSISQRAQKIASLITPLSIRPMRVALISGGETPEREVSKISSQYFINGLDEKYECRAFHIDEKGKWLFQKEDDQGTLSLRVFCALKECEVAFPILHGPKGEDGMMQGFLETLKVPYVGADYSFSSAAMHKRFTKAILEKEGLPLVPDVSLKRGEEFVERVDCFCASHPFPLFVKPCHLGSSVGVYKCENREELLRGIKDALLLDNEVLIEKGIHGREFEVAVLGEYVSLPGEIHSQNRFYDYAAKYSQDPIQKSVVADLSFEKQSEIRSLAQKAFRALGGEGFCRIDFLMDSQGSVYVNEINPFPGCTPKSLFPRMLQEMGFSPTALIDLMIQEALYRARNSNKVLQTDLLQESILKVHALR